MVTEDRVLTGDLGGGHEGGVDVRVHLDGQLLLLHDLLVALLHGRERPVGEGPANEGVEEGDQPLPRQLVVVSGVGKVGGGVGVLRGLLEELPDAQPLVLGHREVFDSVTV